MMVLKNQVRKDLYFDSVTLMVASSMMRQLEGVENAAVMMGTDHNRQLMTDSGLLASDMEAFGVNDTVVGIRAESQEAAQAAMDLFESYISGKTAEGRATGEDRRARTVAAAKADYPGSNLAVVSVPGRFARAEAEKSMSQGLHVLLFSDNVSLEDEVELKKIATKEGLLMMGPDCGTAIINGIALGFANKVRRGGIGLVAAAGTGLQEVTVLIDQLGGGISQALGTGGRDLKEAVGGAMMSLCLEALENDPQTRVITILSKPPHPSVMKKILAQLSGVKKPVIAAFLGGDAKLLEGTNVTWAPDLEAAAVLSVKAEAGQPLALDEDDSFLDALAMAECAKLQPGQKYMRGLYSGGTLCYETILLLRDQGIDAWSNIALDPAWAIEGGEASRDNTLMDMGEDFFTNGSPHPMIDFRQRLDRMEKEAADPEMGVMLLDCVGGYGTHSDPAGELAPGIRAVKGKAAAAGRHVTVIASVTATESDPQVRSRQVKMLEEAGALVLPCNAQAAKLTAKILRQMAQR